MSSTRTIARLVLKDKGTALCIEYANGRRHELSALLLRAYSTSAENDAGRATDAKIAALADDIRILRVEPVGNYAVRIAFDDGHDTGLYTLEYLCRLDERTSEYMAHIAAARAHA